MTSNSVLNFPWEEESYFFKKHYRLKFFETILQDMSPGCLLDCGTGAALLPKAMALKGWKCYGFDGRLTIDPGALPSNVLIEAFELQVEKTELPFPGIMFDAIIASGFIDYLDSFEGFFEQVAGRITPNGSFLFSAINGHHENSRRFPGHSDWKLHYPETIVTCLLRHFHKVYLFPMEEVDARYDEREKEVILKAYNSKLQIYNPDEAKMLSTNSDNIQQFTFLAQSVK